MNADSQESPTTEPPGTADLQFAIRLLDPDAWELNPNETLQVQRVVTFLEQLAPMMDLLKQAISRGNMPTMESLSAMLPGGTTPPTT